MNTLEGIDGQGHCDGCGLDLPITKFKVKDQKRYAGQRFNQCNRCLYIKYTRPESQRKVAEIHTYQIDKGCADCGYNKHPAALEFDHRPGEVKLFNIGEKMGCYSRIKLWAEIAKCDVVCANCHAIRTVERRCLVG